MLTTSPGVFGEAEQQPHRPLLDREPFSPFREIWPDAGLTHQSPMRSMPAIGCCMPINLPLFNAGVTMRGP